MSATNQEPNPEAEYWNNEGGQRWVTYIDRLELLVELVELEDAERRHGDGAGQEAEPEEGEAGVLPAGAVYR